MRKFAFDYWNSASRSVHLHRPAIPSRADETIAAIGMSIIWVSFVFVVFPDLDLAVSRWFASGQTFVWADNPFLLNVREAGRLAQPYIIGSMIVLITLQWTLPKQNAVLLALQAPVRTLELCGRPASRGPVAEGSHWARPATCTCRVRWYGRFYAGLAVFRRVQPRRAPFLPASRLRPRPRCRC